jgi:RNA polymerase sigma-70 factor (family 1)
MAEKNVDNVCKEATFDRIYRENSKDLFNFFYYKYGADNNPDDLVQEAFIKLWNNCNDVIPDKARAFLFTVGNNQMLNNLAKKKTALNYKEQKHKSHTDESPQYLLEEKEYMNKLQNAIENLSEEQRTTFLLNRIEGKKHQEIADMLGISRKAVEKRIYTALAILREKVGNI